MGRLRLLTQALEKNLSCQSIDLSRKGLNDEDGVSIAGMLKVNVGLEKIETEGNSLGVKSATSIAESLFENETLRSLNLDGNNLTASGNDQTGVIALANALRANKSLRVLLLGTTSHSKVVNISSRQSSRTTLSQCWISREMNLVWSNSEESMR